MKIGLKKMGGVAVPITEDDYEKWMKFSDAEYIVDMKNMDSRTVAQNRALHLWCSQLSRLLNSNGIYMTGIFGNKIVWTMELVKTQIVKGTIKKVFNINSTTKLKRKEIDGMVDYITDTFASIQLEVPPFPSKDLWEK